MKDRRERRWKETMIAMRDRAGERIWDEEVDGEI